MRTYEHAGRLAFAQESDHASNFFTKVPDLPAEQTAKSAERLTFRALRKVGTVIAFITLPKRSVASAGISTVT
jgi:hypothetical protein